MLDTEKPYLFNSEKTATIFNKEEETIETDCNSVLFINNGTTNAFIVLTSIPIRIEPKEVFSFDNDPQFFEKTSFDKIYFEGNGINNLIMIKSFTRKREDEEDEN